MNNKKCASILSLIVAANGLTGCTALSDIFTSPSHVVGNYKSTALWTYIPPFFPWTYIFSKSFEECKWEEGGKTDNCDEISVNINKPKLSLTSLPVDLPEAPNPPKAINLSDNGLAKYMEVLEKEKRDKTFIQYFQEALITPLKQKPDVKTVATGLKVDNVYQRAIYVTVENSLKIPPADRLTASKVSIWFEPLKENLNIPASFDSWDQPSTTSSAVNIGSIKGSSTNTQEVSLQVGTPGTGATPDAPFSGSLGGKSNHNSGTEQNLTLFLPLEELTVGLDCYVGQSSDSAAGSNPSTENTHSKQVDKVVNCHGHQNQLTIYKHSVQGGRPLTGNTNIKVKINVGRDCSQHQSLNADKSLELQCSPKAVSLSIDKSDPKKTNLIAEPFNVPSPFLYKDGVKANIELEYVLRHVVSGGDTIEEADDSVKYIQSKVMPKPVVLIPKEELNKYYGISIGANTGSNMFVEYLNIDNQIDRAYLCFSDSKQAEQFVKDFKNKLFKPLMPHKMTFYKQQRDAGLNTYEIKIKKGDKLEPKTIHTYDLLSNMNIAFSNLTIDQRNDPSATRPEGAAPVDDRDYGQVTWGLGCPVQTLNSNNIGMAAADN